MGKALKVGGFEVKLLREIMASNSPDPLVAAAAEASGSVLVSFDKDFNAIASRTGVSNRRFKKLSRIHLGCSEPQAAGRVKAAISLIEHEWQVAQTSTDQRMIVEIGTTVIKTQR